MAVKTLILSIVIGLLSSGWVIPLAVSGFVLSDMYDCYASGITCSFPHGITAARLLALSCAWLGLVVFVWAARLFYLRSLPSEQ